MSTNEQPPLGNVVAHKEPWYKKFIPFSVEYTYHQFMNRNAKSNLVTHAENELAHMLTSDCEMDQLMAEQVIELIELFSKHGHSGFSAPYAIDLFSRLAKYDIIRPLLGNDEEWCHISTDDTYELYQNKRASHVFKHVYSDNTPDYIYDINGKVFRESNGCTFTNGDSRVQVQMPYIPHTEYIDVIENTVE